MFGIGKCRKCGNEYAREIQLAGGFITYLCSDCRNSWGEFIRNKSNFIKYATILEIDLKIAINKNNIDTAHRLAEELCSLQEKLYEVGKKWCQERKN